MDLVHWDGLVLGPVDDLYVGPKQSFVRGDLKARIWTSSRGCLVIGFV